MNKFIPDLVQRREAISPEGSYIVQAPAGSGKTTLLVQRYLKLLALVDHPEEIVAITFTRKAAAEMQGRIVTALERARLNVPTEDEVTRVTDELAREVLARDEKQEWRLEQNPGRLRIQTIDSLCAGLTRQMPVLAKFGAQPEIVEDASDLYTEAAAKTLAELESGESWSEDIAVLLAHLDNNLPLVRDMLANMLKRRDQWLRHVTRENRQEELEAALQHIVESTLSLVRRSFPEQHVLEFLHCLRYASENLVRENCDSPYRGCAGIDDLPGTTTIELPRWRAIAEFCLTGQNHWRKQADARIGFPAASGSAREKEQRKDMKDRFQAWLSQLSGNDDLLRLLVEVRNLPPLHYTDNEWRVVRALCNLLVLADAQFRVTCSERSQVDFTGISRAAIEALESDEAPTDLALHLDYRIRHILIDEYQDVSIQQYRLVQQLTAGWAPGDGHTLFLVGDPMQSIYRFREAEVGLFITTWQEQRLGQVPLAPLNITVNFRSRAGIVDWVNRTFSRVLPRIADSARGAVSYTPADAYHRETAPDDVTVHPLFNRDDDAEAEKTVQLIRAARDQNKEGKIAVLARNRKHLAEIVPALKKAGLPFRAVEIEGLGQRPPIRDLLALTLALHHPADRISWLACLRAPWCGLDLGDLLALAGGDKTGTIRERLLDDNVLQNLSREGRGRLEKLRTVLERYFSIQRRRSLRRSIESVWMSLGGPATIDNETDLENAQTYFALLDRFEQGGDLRDRERFIEAVEQLFAAPDVHADECLQIMTMHKSKGLEFDTVILPGLGRGSARDEPGLLLWTEHPHGQHQDLLLAPIQGTGQDTVSIYDFVRRLEKEKQQYELGRLLYVACTRAKRQLHLLAAVGVNSNGELGKPRADSLLMQIWPVVEPLFNEAFADNQPRDVTEENAVSVKTNLLRRLAPDWDLPNPPAPVQWKAILAAEPHPEEMPEYEWAGEAIRNAGIIAHRYLQKIAEEGLASWNAARVRTLRPACERALRQLGVRDADMEEACTAVEQALLNVISDERGRWILHPGHTDAHNEYRLSGILEGRFINVIIDRTFVDADGARWIIDYKTSRHEGPDVDRFLDQEQDRYRAQLGKYGALLQHCDGRPIRMGLYFPLLRGWRETGS